ncbi:MAG: hypothetical protein CVT95_11405 [Bacteroidetes bacterium HGW-Bacteroidetes-12]|nr:MAG: hypothetical protein CVT95_11405 [Bacteroidetes bacterium HGW-Bacteroidetes-12]
MANIRDLKKDVKQMVEHFIQECYIHLAYSPPLNQENVLDIISDAMELEKEMIIKLNSPIYTNKKESRAYFKNLSGNFYDSIVELIERLNSLSY